MGLFPPPSLPSLLGSWGWDRRDDLGGLKENAHEQALLICKAQGRSKRRLLRLTKNSESFGH